MSESQEVLTVATAPPAGLAEDEAMSQDLMQSTTDQPVSKRLGHFLTHRTFHHIIFTLIIIDSVIILIEVGYNFLRPPSCEPPEPPGRPELEQPTWLEVLLYISIGITSLFLVEIPLTLWAFGPRYYHPLSKDIPHSGFHLFDAFVIITSFIMDVVLRGREREFAGLLILLRLWRLVKLVGGVAAGFDELTEDLTHKLQRAEAEARARTVELEEAKATIVQLQAKLDSYQP